MILNLLRFILSQMAENGIPLTKINIQKFVFYLREVGIPVQFKYEPYIYGPYSCELKSALRDLEIHGELLEQGSVYETKELQLGEKEIPLAIKEKTIAKIKAYQNALGNQFHFDNMEKTGTVIYCAKALEQAGQEPTNDKILSEFIAWKGNKYSKDQIEDAIERVKPILN